MPKMVYVYVANSGSGTISVINPHLNKVIETISLTNVGACYGECNPYYLAYDPSNYEIYVQAFSAYSSDTVLLVINTTTNSLNASLILAYNSAIARCAKGSHMILQIKKSTFSYKVLAVSAWTEEWT